MTHFRAFANHVKEQTPLGKSMLKDPIQSFFFIMRGNFIRPDDWSWVSCLYRTYAKFKWGEK